MLVLDDWGIAPVGDLERRDLLEIIEDRHGNRSTLLTSQIPVAKWHDHLGDPTVADASARSDRGPRLHGNALEFPAFFRTSRRPLPSGATQKGIIKIRRQP